MFALNAISAVIANAFTLDKRSGSRKSDILSSPEHR